MTDLFDRTVERAAQCGGTVASRLSVEALQAVLDAPNVWTPCRENPAGWDIDQSGSAELWAAVRACRVDCPLLAACAAVARSGRVSVRAMVWAGVVYDERGRVLDLNKPHLRVGTYQKADTRTPDDAGRVYNGHTGRWEPPLPPRLRTL